MSKVKSASKIKVNSFDDLFGMSNTYDTEDYAVKEIPLDELFEFKNHPFRLNEDKITEIAESIKVRGVLVPGICRLRPAGGYEILAGHTRKAACEKAGLATMPMVVRNISDDEAVIVMIDSNIQREDVMVSEKAKAYKMKYDAIKNRGTDGNSLSSMSEETGDNVKKIQRYIWLARLSDDFLNMIDKKELGFMQGVDLSFLNEDEQSRLLVILKKNNLRLTKAQTAMLKAESQKDGLSDAIIWEILLPKNTETTRRKIVFKDECLNNYFPDNYSDDDIMNVILGLLDKWKEEGERGVPADE
jgi:ParB family chromosome partitioning protein